MNCRGPRRWLNLLLFLLLLQPVPTSAIDRLSASIFKFIYGHESICGDQFGDLAWMPAHDHCELNCDLLTEICQLSSDKSSLVKQRCLQLPHDCTSALSLHLYSLGLTDKRRTEPRFDGITISGTTNDNMHFGFSTLKPTTLEPLKPNGLSIKHIKEERVTVTSSPEAALIEGQFKEFQSNFNEFFEGEETEGETIDPQVTLMSQEPETTTQIQEYNDQAYDNNIFMSDKNIFEHSPAPEISTTQAFEFQEVTDSRLEMPSSVPTPPSEVHIFGPPFVEKQHAAPTFPLDSISDLRRLPASLGEFDKERERQPWSWKDLSDRLKRPWSLQNRPDKDLSHRCCQWALDGLCDRSWQRVRVLCPKSCGNVVCSSADGALSCNRAIDVDVVDCYEKRKHNLQSISSRFYDTQPSYHSFQEEPVNQLNILPEEMHFGWTTTKTNTVPPQYFSTAPALHNRMPPVQRAYAVEAEIRKFKSSRNFG
ncbi:unnamed protein product [Bursaphelenchus xylophilus]|uniref:(pine wood nematode) hypothetical protein n=1 Tax=Bursaphelenchus xylophilus TaxID=6326 RepID=A0A1I7RZ81_BURXY|nr:unnamed protein product [Bursaphelenchus xylophilus]CAG9106757.1 unnamed protein product [Bursaphelenchus xylophilus]